MEEVLSTLGPVVEADNKYLSVIEMSIEPERIVQFRVPWYLDFYFCPFFMRLVYH